ncbi:tRNA synthetases class I family protein, partial [Vibrio parahaemolyticus V-223/04]
LRTSQLLMLVKSTTVTVPTYTLKVLTNTVVGSSLR